MESAGTKTQMTLSHPRPKLSTRGVARVVADDGQTLCLGLERVVRCRDTYELLNNIVSATPKNHNHTSLISSAADVK